MIFGALYSADPEQSDDQLDKWEDIEAGSWQEALRFALTNKPEGLELAKLTLLVIES